MKNLTLALLLLVSTFAQAETAKPKTVVTWWGHATFQILTPKGVSIVIDPWLTNPANPANKGGNAEAAIKAIGKCDYILVTHGHFDHVGDAVALAKATHATLVTNLELGNNMVRLLGFPKDQATMATLGNIGGQIDIAEGDVKVHFTQAVHSSGLDTGKAKEPIAYGGNPVGFVLEIKNGPTIYDTGDTAFFSDMSLIGKQFHVDLALVNIGGHYGMEPAQAADAAEAVRPDVVVPMHFKTFPILTASAEPFFKLLDSKHIGHFEMQPGKSIEFDGTKFQK